MHNKPLLIVGLFLSIVVLIIVFFVGFISRDKSPCEGIEEKFATKKDKNLHIYVDDSISMRGFVGKKDSLYSSFVRRYLPSIVGNINYRVFGFGDNVVPTDISRIASGDFYNKGITVFSNAFNNILREQPNGFIIISDLVISVRSEEGVERANVASQIGQLSQDGYNFILKGTNSQFRGIAYSELLGDVPISSSDFEIRRPFYILIGYKKGFDLRNLISLKSIEDSEFKEISFTDNTNITSINMDFSKSDFIPKKKEDRCVVVKWHDDILNNSQIEMIINEKKDPKKDVENLQIREITSKIIPQQKGDSSDVKLIGKPEFENNKIYIKMEIPHINIEGKYTYYAIDLIVKGENIKLPNLVDNWSTSDDSRPENYYKTFGLRDFVVAMTNAIVKSERLYLVTENNEYGGK